MAARNKRPGSYGRCIVIHVVSEKLKGISKEEGVVSKRSLQYIGRFFRATGKKSYEEESTVRRLLIQQNAAHDVERVIQTCVKSGLSVLGLHESRVLLRVTGELDAASAMEEISCLVRVGKLSLAIQGEVMVKFKEGQVGAMSMEVAN